MYHPAPAVKRGHLGNVKTNRFITLSGVLEIIFRGADEPALLGKGHGRSRRSQRVGAAGLDLTEHQCAVRLPQDEVDLPHPSAVVVGHQLTSLLLVIPCGHSLTGAAGLSPIHHLPSGQ